MEVLSMAKREEPEVEEEVSGQAPELCMCSSVRIALCHIC